MLHETEYSLLFTKQILKKSEKYSKLKKQKTSKQTKTQRKKKSLSKAAENWCDKCNYYCSNVATGRSINCKQVNHILFNSNSIPLRIIHDCFATE